MFYIDTYGILCINNCAMCDESIEEFDDAVYAWRLREAQPESDDLSSQGDFAVVHLDHLEAFISQEIDGELVDWGVERLDRLPAHITTALKGLGMSQTWPSIQRLAQIND